MKAYSKSENSTKRIFFCEDEEVEASRFLSDFPKWEETTFFKAVADAFYASDIKSINIDYPISGTKILELVVEKSYIKDIWEGCSVIYVIIPEWKIADKSDMFKRIATYFRKHMHYNYELRQLNNTTEEEILDNPPKDAEMVLIPYKGSRNGYSVWDILTGKMIYSIEGRGEDNAKGHK